LYTIQHNPARLYNCDETSITIVQHKHTKVLSLKGKRQISSVQSAERGYVVTVVNRMSPTGQFIPQLLVFPKKYMKPEMMKGTPPGSIHACHHSGCIQRENFTQRFLNFVKHTFIHSIFCLTTRSKPPPKRFLHIVRSRASSFK